MGRMKDKLMDMMENPDYYESESIDMSDEYEILLPKGVKAIDVWKKIDRFNREEEEKEGREKDSVDELDFD